MLIDPAALTAFTLLNMSFALIPGPDVVYIVSQSLARGLRGGTIACFGIASGTSVHILAAAAGLTALLMAVPAAFIVVKVAGAVYLVWIGVQLWRSADTLRLERAERAPYRRIFFNGALSNALNPKVAIFFLAFLPQFVDPGRGNPALQAVLLGFVSMLSGTAVNLVTATLAALARERLLQSTAVRALVQKLAGAVLVGLGLRMAVSRNAG